MYETPPDGFTIDDHRAKKSTIKNDKEVTILGTRMSPTEVDESPVSTVKKEYRCEHLPPHNYVPGNVVAIPNPFYKPDLDENKTPLYIVTSPYEVNTFDVTKFKMIPLNPNAEYVRIHTQSEEDESTLLTDTGKAHPTSTYAVPDIVVADACGKSEKMLNRRI